MRNFRWAIVPVLAGAAMLAGWLTSSPTHSGSAATLSSTSATTTAAVTTSNVANSPAWANEGKQALATPLVSVPNSTINDQVGAPGVFRPVLSQPVNISQPGDVTLTAGPVTPGSKPTTITVVFPSDSRSFFTWDYPFVTAPHLVQANGVTAVQIVVRVTHVSKSYDGFTVWFM